MKHVGNEIGVPGTYRNFYRIVLFLFHVTNVFKYRKTCKLGRELFLSSPPQLVHLRPIVWRTFGSFSGQRTPGD